MCCSCLNRPLVPPLNTTTFTLLIVLPWFSTNQHCSLQKFHISSSVHKFYYFWNIMHICMCVKKVNKKYSVKLQRVKLWKENKNYEYWFSEECFVSCGFLKIKENVFIVFILSFNPGSCTSKHCLFCLPENFSCINHPNTVLLFALVTLDFCTINCSV